VTASFTNASRGYHLLLLTLLPRQPWLLMLPPIFLVTMVNSVAIITTIFIVVFVNNVTNFHCWLWLSEGTRTISQHGCLVYRVIHKSLRNFRTRLCNNQERHGRKEHINRYRISQSFFLLGALAYLQVPPLGGSRDEKWRAQ